MPNPLKILILLSVMTVVSGCLDQNERVDTPEEISANSEAPFLAETVSDPRGF